MTEAGEAQIAPPALILSVIVPTRNDQRTIDPCLQSLLAQSEPGWLLGEHWELIVVDDQSTDQTVAQARALGVTTVAARAPLPRGATGENNALATGLAQARGAWILLTGADTVHRAGSLSRSVVEAERYNVGMLSWEPAQRSAGWIERSVLPLIWSEVETAYPVAKVNDPPQRVARATRQFLLARESALRSVGGIERTAGSLIWDLDLAFAAKRDKHVGLRYRHAPEMLETLAPASAGAMWDQWRSHLALMLPGALALCFWRTLDFALVWGLPLVALFVLPGVGEGSPLLRMYQVAVGLFWLRTLIRVARRARRSRMPGADIAAAVSIGLPVFAALCYASWFRVRTLRRVVWKGREYSVAG